jgi:hypothetical protein
MKNATRALLVVFLLSCCPPPSQAIQLRWESGGSDLEFASATRCTLHVQADDIERAPAPYTSRGMYWTCRRAPEANSKSLRSPERTPLNKQ